MALSMHPRPTHPLHFYHPLLSWAGGSSPPDRVSTQSPPSTRMCARTLQVRDSVDVNRQAKHEGLVVGFDMYNMMA